MNPGILNSWASLVSQMVKTLPAVWESWVSSLGWEDPLEKGMATHTSILAWGIPWTRSLAGNSPQDRRVSTRFPKLEVCFIINPYLQELVPRETEEKWRKEHDCPVSSVPSRAVLWVHMGFGLI